MNLTCFSVRSLLTDAPVNLIRSTGRSRGKVATDLEELEKEIV